MSYLRSWLLSSVRPSLISAFALLARAKVIWLFDHGKMGRERFHCGQFCRNGLAEDNRANAHVSRLLSSASHPPVGHPAKRHGTTQPKLLGHLVDRTFVGFRTGTVPVRELAAIQSVGAALPVLHRAAPAREIEAKSTRGRVTVLDGDGLCACFPDTW